ncbi:MAG: ferrochelatase, partial [Pseudomonadota bacterium]|nr:ferrochelatase [Pseudomonadota bacterium]
YGSPSIPSVLASLRERHCERILLLSLYPQYAASTVGTVFDVVFRELTGLRNPPELRLVKHYHDDPRYIAALAQSVRDYWMTHGRPDKLLMSFHGVPKATLEAGDPYHCECQKTGRLLAEALGLEASRYQVCFQSRFGRSEWLQPYTAGLLTELGRQKTGRVDVVCPGFVADCLETLEEIAMEGKAIFLEAGGGEFHAIPCLNERDDWMHALTGIALDNLGGWVGAESDQTAARDEQSRQRALRLGAKR